MLSSCESLEWQVCRSITAVGPIIVTANLVPLVLKPGC